ncbi:hypothetical protein WJX84_001377 [Apatococcus fuscideae]|uniref:Exostosin GT47 domain-containing protein n=1 Tax=Apatococcus fuscideae TaxID=2026836 RepID=A0AAW1S4B3_9CHLO
MPQRFTQDILAMPLDQSLQTWTQWYDLDQHVHRFLQNSTALTQQPESARLFFIPVYLGRLYHSLLIESGLPHSECLRHVTARVLDALQHVRQTFPYWDGSNGQDHFMVFPMDHGRCHALAGENQHVMGELFAVQPTGDLALTDFETRRPSTLAQTHADMKQSVFCVCPNGISQHTLRVFRSILAGCIPVTFFRAFDNPLERNLGLDWSAFSVNINPDEYMLTQQTLTKLLANPRRIQTMQTALQGVQPLFEWHSGRSDGVEHNMLRELNLLLDTSPVLANG